MSLDGAMLVRIEAGSVIEVKLNTLTRETNIVHA